MGARTGTAEVARKLIGHRVSRGACDVLFNDDACRATEGISSQEAAAKLQHDEGGIITEVYLVDIGVESAARRCKATGTGHFFTSRGICAACGEMDV